MFYLEISQNKKMDKVKKGLLFVLTGVLLACNQSKPQPKTYVGYTNFEIETEECIDLWLKEKDVEENEIKTIFEQYFIDAKMSKASDPIEKQYQDILNSWEKPSKRFPPFKDKNKINTIRTKLGLSERDIVIKTHLNCLLSVYETYYSHLDTKSLFNTLGSILEDTKKMQGANPGISAGTMNKTITEEDLKKPIYQKTLALMFCFDMALFLKDDTGH